MFRARFLPIIRSTRLYLQLLVMSTDVAAGWRHGWDGTPWVRPLVWIAAFDVLRVSFRLVHRLIIFTRHSRRFIASSDVKFPFFITPSTSVSQFASGRPRLRLPSGELFSIRLGHLLTSMRTTCPYDFNMLFTSLSKMFCVRLRLKCDGNCAETKFRLSAKRTGPFK